MTVVYQVASHTDLANESVGGWHPPGWAAALVAVFGVGSVWKRVQVWFGDLAPALQAVMCRGVLGLAERRCPWTLTAPVL